MALYISSLNSGSNGNCYYVGNNEDAVLIDVGLSCRETEIRLKHNGLDIKKVKAIFVSHEHSDHIKGVSTLAHKYQLPIYITPATASNGFRLIKHLAKPFVAKQPIAVGGLQVTAFKKHHDAIDPYSFVVSYNNITVGVFTDIGIVCKELIYYFKQCHAAFLESNYDELMLENGKYPIQLKNRIRGGNGHLSNKQALELFVQHRSPYITHLLLAHLSKENNSHQLVLDTFLPHANNTHISIASRYQASEVFTITPNVYIAPAKVTKPIQMALFG